MAVLLFLFGVLVGLVTVQAVILHNHIDAARNEILDAIKANKANDLQEK